MSSSTTTENSRASSSERESQACDFGAELSSECGEQREDFQALMEDVGSSVAKYCRKRPLMAALSVFAVGFYVGWKIKPW
jgi:hypothetical protein